MPLVKSLIIDSGAFSVWTQGAVVNLDEYINFCRQFPKVTGFICLDVIPPSLGKGRGPKSDELEWTAEEGFNNYLKMIRVLPQEQVIPVFHQGEDLKWLDKYLNMDVPYLGIGAIAKMGPSRTQKLQELRKYLVDSEGKPRTRFHGLGLNSFQDLKVIPWYSVDSVAWVFQAAYGSIWIPKLRNAKFRYDVSPYVVGVSPKSPKRDKKQNHINNLTPTVRGQVEYYFSSVLKMGLGDYSLVDVDKGYKKCSGELWFDGSRGRIVRVRKKGLATSYHRRIWANMRFTREANKVLAVNSIYFAGAEGSILPQIEFNLEHRLMSYCSIERSKRSREVFDRHMEVMA